MKPFLISVKPNSGMHGPLLFTFVLDAKVRYNLLCLHSLKRFNQAQIESIETVSMTLVLFRLYQLF